MKQPKITNSDEIKTSQLLDSLSSLDFNHYNYLISNNELQFVKNPGQRTILWNDNFGEAFNDSKNTYIVLFISFIVVNIILIALTAILISKRLTRPLSFTLIGLAICLWANYISLHRNVSDLRIVEHIPNWTHLCRN